MAARARRAPTPPVAAADRCRADGCRRPIVRDGRCSKHHLLERASRAQLPNPLIVATFTYPSTGTIHVIDGDFTLCGGVWTADFQANHPYWAALFNPAGFASDVTCRACRRRMEHSE